MDRKFRLARVWSNKELYRIASIFGGKVINVSAWNDQDKQGNRYRDYFVNCSEYHVSNFSDSKGVQGLDNEIFIDLQKEISPDLAQQFDVVFNHTTLEHVYDFMTAFSNLVKLSKDIVILVVPFSQTNHGNSIPDYWRFTPQSLNKMFLDNGMEVIYSSYNNDKNAGIYLFYVASKGPFRWEKSKLPKNIICDYDLVGNKIGARPIMDLLMKMSSRFLSR